ncbi:MAG: Serine/threonine-protein kinase PknD [Phycisphaerae bacterium]|nr:Serine/threonine-protein kinase PknD [Phycisphaerae bacterium]
MSRLVAAESPVQPGAAAPEALSDCALSEEQLWSWVDRDADELSTHVEGCSRCRALVHEIRSGMNAVRISSDAPRAVMPEMIGPYKVIRLLGQGGQGLVYEAVQPDPHRRVALKVVRGGRFVDPQNIRLFEREVQTLARMRHPAIGAIYEAGITPEGLRYFAMELIEGRPITRYVRESRLELPRRLRLFRDVCLAIHHAHQRGVIHRDLKPTNVLVDNAGQPKVLDFGLARVAGEHAGAGRTFTGMGNVLGTLPYMSPEQASGRSDEIDVRCDVYSLGVVLYELLTGRLPLVTRSKLPHEAVRQICEEEPPRPSTLDRALRGDPEAIILKALAKDPQQRYQSAAALADDIDRCLAGQPITARPPNTRYQLYTLIRRHKLAFASATAIFLLTCGSAVWVSLLYSSASREARKATQINQFLQTMLSSYDPYNPKGQTTTVHEVLREATQRIETDVEMAREVEAAIRETIGNTYLSLGRYQEAESHLWRVLQFHENTLARDDPKLAASRHNMARLLQAKGDYRNAEPLYRQALQIRRDRFGDLDVRAAETLHHLAEVVFAQGRRDEAEVMMRNALRTRRALLGETHLDVAESLHGLGVILRDTGKTEEAEQRLKQALTMRIQLVGGDHPYSADALNDLAILDDGAGRFSAAEGGARLALSIREARLPVDHPDLGESLATLGRILVHQNQTAEAEALLRRAVDLHGGTVPALHDRLGDARVALGECLMAQERFAEAEALLLEAWDSMRQHYGEVDARARSAGAALDRLYQRWEGPGIPRLRPDPPAPPADSALPDAGHTRATPSDGDPR